MDKNQVYKIIKNGLYGSIGNGRIYDAKILEQYMNKKTIEDRDKIIDNIINDKNHDYGDGNDYMSISYHPVSHTIDVDYYPNQEIEHITLDIVIKKNGDILW